MSSAFFIEIETRRVHLAGITGNPTGSWVAQQARDLAVAGTLDRCRFLIRDRDSKFTGVFDEVFASEGIRVVRTPIARPSRTPTQNDSCKPCVASVSTGSDRQRAPPPPRVRRLPRALPPRAPTSRARAATARPSESNEQWSSPTPRPPPPRVLPSRRLRSNRVLEPVRSAQATRRHPRRPGADRAQPRDLVRPGCGNRGCVEAYAGRRSMAATASAMVEAGRSTSLFEIRDAEGKQHLTSKVWARALMEADPLAEQLFEMAVETLGVGVASVINTLDVELVVIGGGLAEKLGQDLADRIERAAAPSMLRPASRWRPSSRGRGV